MMIGLAMPRCAKYAIVQMAYRSFPPIGMVENVVLSEISHGLGRPTLEHLLFLGPIDTQLMTSGIYSRLVEAVDGPVN